MDKFKLLCMVLASASVLFASGCKSDNKGNSGTVDSSLEASAAGDKFGETFYQIPSPEEMFTFIKDGNLTYSPKFINSIDNLKKYVDDKTKELNFGIYCADLAYAAAFNRYQESLKGIETVRKISEDIGISSVFDEALNKRIQNIFENPDSLLNVTNTAYYKVVSYLEENERNRTLALISIGGWLESMYIITNLVDKYSDNNKTIQRIADQRLTFNNLLQYLKKHESDPYVKEALEKLSSIKLVYDSLQEVEIQNKSNPKVGRDVIVLGGKKKIIIKKDQFEKLKTAIADYRKTITGN